MQIIPVYQRKYHTVGVSTTVDLHLRPKKCHQNQSEKKGSLKKRGNFMHGKKGISKFCLKEMIFFNACSLKIKGPLYIFFLMYSDS